MIKAVIFDMFETLVTHYESPVYMGKQIIEDIGDGGSFELETASSLGMKSFQAAWYLKDGVNQPAKRMKEFIQIESPLDVLYEINKVV